MRILPVSTVALLVTAAAASRAAAQEAPTCPVEILRAPPEVQPVIEEWVRAERVCGPALKVRVVPTVGGLYVLAEDANGRVRERVVPDATTAAVLIASWAADDAAPAAPLTPPAPPSAAPGTAIAMEPPVPPAPPPAPPAPPPAPPSMPPSSVVLVDGGSGGRRGSRSLDVGVVVTANADTLSSGVKVGVDLATRFGLRLGVAGAYARTAYPFYGYYTYAPERVLVHDLRLTGRAALERATGRWSGRLELGLGVVVSSLTTMDAGSASGAAPYGELGVTLGYQVSSNWRLRGGPVFTLSAQTIQGGVALSRGGSVEGWAGLDRAF